MDAQQQPPPMDTRLLRKCAPASVPRTLVLCFAPTEAATSVSTCTTCPPPRADSIVARNPASSIFMSLASPPRASAGGPIAAHQANAPTVQRRREHAERLANGDPSRHRPLRCDAARAPPPRSPRPPCPSLQQQQRRQPAHREPLGPHEPGVDAGHRARPGRRLVVQRFGERDHRMLGRGVDGSHRGRRTGRRSTRRSRRGPCLACSIPGRNARVPFITPRMFTLTMRSICSYESSSNRPPPGCPRCSPARRPARTPPRRPWATTRARSRFGDVAPARPERVRPPARSARRGPRAGPGGARRERPSAPRCANATAVASPIPDDAPVTTTTAPSKLHACLLYDVPTHGRYRSTRPPSAAPRRALGPPGRHSDADLVGALSRRVGVAGAATHPLDNVRGNTRCCSRATRTRSSASRACRRPGTWSASSTWSTRAPARDHRPRCPARAGRHPPRSGRVRALGRR